MDESAMLENEWGWMGYLMLDEWMVLEWGLGSEAGLGLVWGIGDG